MLGVAVAVTLVAGFLGIYISFFLDSAPAPTVILVLTAIFVAAFVLSVRHTTVSDASTSTT
jgi:manganese/iron transport system permease protein